MADRDYTITSQRQDRGFNAANQVVDVVEVSWQGPNGITGSITVPKVEFSAERVDQLVRADLATHLAVANLGAGS